MAESRPNPLPYTYSCTIVDFACQTKTSDAEKISAITSKSKVTPYSLGVRLKYCRARIPFSSVGQTLRYPVTRLLFTYQTVAYSNTGAWSTSGIGTDGDLHRIVIIGDVTVEVGPHNPHFFAVRRHRFLHFPSPFEAILHCHYSRRLTPTGNLRREAPVLRPLPWTLSLLRISHD